MSFADNFVNLVGYGTVLYLLLACLPNLAKNLALSLLKAWGEIRLAHENVKEPVPF